MQDQKKAPLPGWKAILVREDTFERLKLIQRENTDPYLDLRYIGDAAVKMAVHHNSGAAVMAQAISDLQKR